MLYKCPYRTEEDRKKYGDLCSLGKGPWCRWCGYYRRWKRYHLMSQKKIDMKRTRMDRDLKEAGDVRKLTPPSSLYKI